MLKLSEWMNDVNACAAATVWVGDRTPVQAWGECQHGDWMLWAAVRAGVDRKVVVAAACACARLALPYTTDPCVERCIDTAERWCREEASLDEVYACAARAANAAVADAARAANAASYAAAAAVDAADAAAAADSAAAAADAAAAAADAADAADADVVAAAAAIAAAAAADAADADVVVAAAATIAADAAAQKTILKECADIARRFISAGEFEVKVMAHFSCE